MNILIVDDNTENLYLLRALLQGHGYHVDEARHGAEALTRAYQTLPDLVISDLLMPVMDGYTLLRHWKTDTRLQQIPFIVHTATYTEPQDERLALDLGADAFIVKPAEPTALMKCVEDVLENRKKRVYSPVKSPTGNEESRLRQYSEVLIHKLEHKMAQLEHANRALEKDITERKRTEEILRESESRFRSLVDSAPEGIFIQSDEHFIYVNQGMLQLLGATKVEDLLGKNIMDSIAPEYHTTVRERIRFQRETGKAVPLMEEEYLRLDGSRVWTETTAIGCKFEGCDARLVFVRDITARRKAEAARDALHAQLLQAQKMESLGRLAGGVAHDFNNQLQAILGFVELLLHTEICQDQRENLEEIERAAKRAADLTRQLLALGRKQIFTPRVLNVNEVITGTQKMLYRLLGEDIQIDARLAMNLKSVQADPGQIEQVIVNLAVNARDAMPHGGRLTIATTSVTVDEQDARADPEMQQGEFVCLAVSDTGIGISKEIKDKIFEPFFTTKGPGKGTGLGLAVIYGIVKQHNGWIHLYSQIEQGTTFKIYLPVYQGAEPTEHVLAQTEQKRARGHGEHVLLVEDEPGVRAIAVLVLQGSGYVVTAAANAAEAREIFEQHDGHFDLLFSDVVLPDQNGIALAEELIARKPGLPVLLCSGYTDERSRWSAIEKGGFEFISKPYPSATLLASLRHILDTASHRTGT